MNINKDKGHKDLGKQEDVLSNLPTQELEICKNNFHSQSNEKEKI